MFIAGGISKNCKQHITDVDSSNSNWIVSLCRERYGIREKGTDSETNNDNYNNK